MKVAFLQDLTVPGASQLVAPSLLGLELALERAAERNDLPVVPDVEAMDTEGDRGRQAEFAQQIADDPAFVAVVEGPFMHLSEVSGAILGKAEIPTVSLSGWDETPSIGTPWWRAVPRLSRSASSARLGDPRIGGFGVQGCVCWTMHRRTATRSRRWYGASSGAIGSRSRTRYRTGDP